MRCEPRLHEAAQRVVGRELMELECPWPLVGVRVRIRAIGILAELKALVRE